MLHAREVDDGELAADLRRDPPVHQLAQRVVPLELHGQQRPERAADQLGEPPLDLAKKPLRLASRTAMSMARPSSTSW